MHVCALTRAHIMIVLFTVVHGASCYLAAFYTLGLQGLTSNQD